MNVNTVRELETSLKDHYRDETVSDLEAAVVTIAEKEPDPKTMTSSLLRVIDGRTLKDDEYVSQYSVIAARQITEENLKDVAAWCSAKYQASWNVYILKDGKFEYVLVPNFWVIRYKTGHYTVIDDLSFKELFTR